MKTYFALFSIAAALYLSAAYTRPQEPAGEFVHNNIIPVIKDAMPECPKLPFSGLLQFDNEYSPRPTLRELEVVPPTATPYTPRELNEIYPTH